MKQRLKKLSKFFAGFGLVSALFFVGTAPRNIFKPTTNFELARVSVSIESKQIKSGGSGVILSSARNESVILTNKHVCEIVKSGGRVVYEGSSYEVQEVKPYPKHDLCFVKVFHSFGVNIKLAEYAPEKYTQATIVGHPRLMPTIMTHGHFSGKDIIKIMVGLRPCTPDDMEQYGLFCLFMGGVPVFKDFETQAVSATIQPGSSGSPVFNARGELSGLAFASSSQELSYAYIVPYEYVYDFLRTEHQYEWIKIKDGARNAKKFTAGVVPNNICHPIATQFNTGCQAIYFPRGF